MPALFDGQLYVRDNAFSDSLGGTSGALSALDEKSGDVVWTTDVGPSIPAPEGADSSAPLTGLGAGGGALIVPAGRYLFAFW